jgi:hypothetical protein
MHLNIHWIYIAPHPAYTAMPLSFGFTAIITESLID